MLSPPDYIHNLKLELKKSKNWKRLRNHLVNQSGASYKWSMDLQLLVQQEIQSHLEEYLSNLNGKDKQEQVEQLIMYLLRQNKHTVKCIKYGMNRNISDSARFEMWLALSNEKELEFSKQNSLDIFEQCLDYLNQRPWSHYILGNYRLVSIMEQFMLLNTGLPFDVGASIAIPILTTINQNKIDEKTWKGIYSRCCLLLGRFFNDDILLNTSRVRKITAVDSNEAETFINDILKSLFVGIFDDSSLTCHIYDCFILYSKESLNDTAMPSISDWILWSTCCIVLFCKTEIEKGDGHYSKLSEMSKADFTTLMEDNYLQDFRNLKLQKLNVAEQDVSSADESEYIKPPQYTHRLKVWNKAKQNQKNTVLSKWRRKVKQVIVWLKYLEELKQLAFVTKMRSMHKQTVEDQETRPVEKQKKINPFVEKDGLSDAGKLIDSIYQNTNKIWGIIEPVKPKRVKFNESKFVSSKDELNTAGNLMDGLIGATETSKILLT